MWMNSNESNMLVPSQRLLIKFNYLCTQNCITFMEIMWKDWILYFCKTAFCQKIVKTFRIIIPNSSPPFSKLHYKLSMFLSYKAILHLKKKMVEFVWHVHFEKKFDSTLILGRYINFFVTVWSRDIINFLNCFHFVFKNRHRVVLSKTNSQIMK